MNFKDRITNLRFKLAHEDSWDVIIAFVLLLALAIAFAACVVVLIGWSVQWTYYQTGEHVWPFIVPPVLGILGFLYYVSGKEHGN